MMILRTILFVLCLWTATAADAPAAEGGYADLAGVKLWYTDTGGNGPAIVMLHANTGTSVVWEKQARAFSAAGYRAIAFDRRGWGKSIPDPASGPQPGSIAGDLDALATHLNLGKFYLLGVAGGGFAALDYAAWHQERLRGLIIAASTGSFSEKTMVDMTNRIAIPGLDKQPAEYVELGLSYRATDPTGTARWNEIETHAHQPGAPAQPLRSPNTFAKIEAILVPTLVVVADADLYAPQALMKMWADHIKNYERTVIDDAGHSVAWEKPEDFNAAVLGFLRKH
jgi:pimeloyl-ACP methyl ester carboxylesterase